MSEGKNSPTWVQSEFLNYFYVLEGSIDNIWEKTLLKESFLKLLFGLNSFIVVVCLEWWLKPHQKQYLCFRQQSNKPDKDVGEDVSLSVSNIELKSSEWV